MRHFVRFCFAVVAAFVLNVALTATRTASA